MKNSYPRLALYSGTQTIYQIGTVMIMAIGALVGQTLAPAPEYAALPLAMTVLGTLAGLFPANLLMGRWGRRTGLAIGSGLGLIGGGLLMVALLVQNFWLLAAGFLVYGLHQAFLQFLRFAAMESVEAAQRPIALSWILVAGIPAAFLGPLAGQWGKTLIDGHLFLGCFVLLTGALVAQLSLVLATPAQPVVVPGATPTATEPARPLRYHLTNSSLWTAILASAFGYGLMIMLMAAAPVAMHSHGHEMGASTLVLQWHVLGMYVPSFFTGFLIKKIGSRVMILLGILVLGLQVAAALQGTDFVPFAVSLTLLGIGWNFMYVGGTNLLVEQYRPSEKSFLQAFNDSFVYLFGTASTFGSAYLEKTIGWFPMNLAALPFLGLTLLVLLLSFSGLRSKNRGRPAAGL